MFLSSLGDGMNAYVAYKVSTRVCKKACVDMWFMYFYMVPKKDFMFKSSLVFFRVLYLISVMSLLSDVHAHVQE